MESPRKIKLSKDEQQIVKIFNSLPVNKRLIWLSEGCKLVEECHKAAKENHEK